MAEGTGVQGSGSRVSGRGGIIVAMVNEERLVSLFKKLCLINAPALKERECVDFAKKYLLDIGLEVREDDAGRKIGSGSTPRST